MREFSLNGDGNGLSRGTVENDPSAITYVRQRPVRNKKYDMGER